MALGEELVEGAADQLEARGRQRRERVALGLHRLCARTRGKGSGGRCVGVWGRGGRALVVVEGREEGQTVGRAQHLRVERVGQEGLALPLPPHPPGQLAVDRPLLGRLQLGRRLLGLLRREEKGHAAVLPDEAVQQRRGRVALSAGPAAGLQQFHGRPEPRDLLHIPQEEGVRGRLLLALAAVLEEPVAPQPLAPLSVEQPERPLRRPHGGRGLSRPGRGHRRLGLGRRGRGRGLTQEAEQRSLPLPGRGGLVLLALLLGRLLGAEEAGALLGELSPQALPGGLLLHLLEEVGGAGGKGSAQQQLVGRAVEEQPHGLRRGLLPAPHGLLQGRPAQRGRGEEAAEVFLEQRESLPAPAPLGRGLVGGGGGRGRGQGGAEGAVCEGAEEEQQVLREELAQQLQGRQQLGQQLAGEADVLGQRERVGERGRFPAVRQQQAVQREEGRLVDGQLFLSPVDGPHLLAAQRGLAVPLLPAARRRGRGGGEEAAAALFFGGRGGAGGGGERVGAQGEVLDAAGQGQGHGQEAVVVAEGLEQAQAAGQQAVAVQTAGRGREVLHGQVAVGQQRPLEGGQRQLVAHRPFPCQCRPLALLPATGAVAGALDELRGRELQRGGDGGEFVAEMALEAEEQRLEVGHLLGQRLLGRDRGRGREAEVLEQNGLQGGVLEEEPAAGRLEEVKPLQPLQGRHLGRQEVPEAHRRPLRGGRG